ncbi:MAG: hypothetical protein CMN30_32330 [Sandaracinus sp.]|nr:hypothetical protein [Sandaracinus sp.]|tara:strand:- start:2855 stop:3064 length:210 start_codon:yes stop_codon:yes gene_type:complete
MYENASVSAKFELYQDPTTGEARIRPRVATAPQRPNPTVVAPTITRRPIPSAWERPAGGPANPGTERLA